MTHEEFRRQAYFASLTGLLAARGKDPVFDEFEARDLDQMDELTKLTDFAEEIANMELISFEFDE